MDSLGSNRASLMQQLPEVIRATEHCSRTRMPGKVLYLARFDTGNSYRMVQGLIGENKIKRRARRWVII